MDVNELVPEPSLEKIKLDGRRLKRKNIFLKVLLFISLVFLICFVGLFTYFMVGFLNRESYDFSQDPSYSYEGFEEDVQIRLNWGNGLAPNMLDFLDDVIVTYEDENGGRIASGDKIVIHFDFLKRSKDRLKIRASEKSVELVIPKLNKNLETIENLNKDTLKTLSNASNKALENHLINEVKIRGTINIKTIESQYKNEALYTLYDVHGATYLVETKKNSEVKVSSYGGTYEEFHNKYNPYFVNNDRLIVENEVI